MTVSSTPSLPPLPALQIDFWPGGPFYEAATAYMAAIGGLVAYTFPNEDLKARPIGIASTLVPNLELRPFEFKVHIDRKDFPLGMVTDALVRLLLNWSYEHIKDAYPDVDFRQLRTDFPEIEFLRHLRNAASHRGGVWTLRSDEPVQPADWRGHSVTKALNGKSIWAVGLQPGDILFLLHDIETHLKARPPPRGW